MAEDRWQPRWQISFDSYATVRADSPEEALEKVNQWMGSVEPESVSPLEGVALGFDKETLRLHWMHGLQMDDEHADEWKEFEVKYPEYVKPRHIFQSVKREVQKENGK